MSGHWTGNKWQTWACNLADSLVALFSFFFFKFKLKNSCLSEQQCDRAVMYIHQPLWLEQVERFTFFLYYCIQKNWYTHMPHACTWLFYFCFWIVFFLLFSAKVLRCCLKCLNLFLGICFNSWHSIERLNECLMLFYFEIYIVQTVQNRQFFDKSNDYNLLCNFNELFLFTLLWTRQTYLLLFFAFDSKLVPPHIDISSNSRAKLIMNMYLLNDQRYR